MNSFEDITQDLNINDMTDREEQTINDIHNLQNIELGLYKSLENNIMNGTLSVEEQQNIINQIDKLSQMRINLFDSLNTMYSFYQENVSNSRDILKEQIFALTIVNNKLNEMKLQLDSIRTENNNKLRLVEINTYYGKQFNSYIEVMYIIICICIFIIIISILRNKNILPTNIFIVLLIIILSIGLIILIRKIYDISLRNNMNFDEYDYKSRPKKNNTSQGDSDTTDDPWYTPSLTGTCIGAECCSDNQYYDESMNLCKENKNKTKKINQ